MTVGKISGLNLVCGFYINRQLRSFLNEEKEDKHKKGVK